MKLQHYNPKTPHIRGVLYEKKMNFFKKILQQFFKISLNRQNIEFGTLEKMSTLRWFYM